MEIETIQQLVIPVYSKDLLKRVATEHITIGGEHKNSIREIKDLVDHCQKCKIELVARDLSN